MPTSEHEILQRRLATINSRITATRKQIKDAETAGHVPKAHYRQLANLQSIRDDIAARLKVRGKL